MIDIEKLKKLSCLHIPKEQESFFQASLDDIFHMMQDIETIGIHEDKQTINQQSTDFSQQQEKLFPIEQHTPGTLLQDSLFLAPKVIHKNP